MTFAHSNLGEPDTRALSLIVVEIGSLMPAVKVICSSTAG
jgi:hypothetical protein